MTPRPARPDYVPDHYEYIPWPHGADLPPVEHRRRRLPRRTRTAILVLVGVALGLLILAVLALAGDPDPSDPPRPVPSVEPARTPPVPDDVIGGDIVWGRPHP